MQGSAGKSVFYVQKTTVNVHFPRSRELNEIINAYKILRRLMGDMILFTVLSFQEMFMSSKFFIFLIKRSATLIGNKHKEILLYYIINNMYFTKKEHREIRLRT